MLQCFHSLVDRIACYILRKYNNNNNNNNTKSSPEELLAILVPPDAVDWLDAGVLAVEDGVLAVHPVLRHLDTGHRHRGVGSGRVQG